jgi:HTH-type transcriptional regulator / antitoxin HipB
VPQRTKLTPRPGNRNGGKRIKRAVPRDAFDKLIKKEIEDDPAFAKAWDNLEAKRRIVSALLRLRARANLTQKELAEKAGWKPSFVSRLESFPKEGEKLHMPDVTTLMRYAEVCGSSFGLLFGEPVGRGAGLHISEAVGLGDNTRFQRDIEAFSNTDVGIQDRTVCSVSKTN